MELKITFDENQIEKIVGLLAEKLKGAAGIAAHTETPIAVSAAPQIVTPVLEQQAAPAVSAVPTSVPKYTLEDLANAAMPLMNAGQQQALIDMLSGFGVVSLANLPEERYPEAAERLRALGAQI